MALRLEELRLIPRGVWEYLYQQGFRPHEAFRLLHLSPLPEDDEVLPSRFVVLAVEAWQRERLSEGQLAGVLRTDRLGARQIIALLKPDEEPEGKRGDIDLAAPLFAAG